MKQRFLKSTLTNVTKDIIYVNAVNGNDANFEANNSSKPAKTIVAAINSVMQMPQRKNVEISLATDAVESEAVNISNSIRKITLNGNGYKVVFGEKISTFNVSGGNLTFDCETIPYSIIVNNRVRQITESCKLSNPYGMFHEEGGALSNGKYRIKIPANFPALQGDEFVLEYHKWMCQYAKIASKDSTYLYLDMEYMDSQVHAAFDSEQYFRLMNSASYQEAGKFYFTKNANGTYHVVYRLDGESVTSVVVPSYESNIVLTSCSNVEIRNIDIVGSKVQFVKDTQACADLEGVISISKCANIKLRETRFIGTDGYCIRIKEGCRRIYVQRCYMRELLGGGISMEGNIETSVKTDYIYIDNNLIKSFGRFHSSAVGVLMRHVSNCSVTYNTICDGYYSGMSIGWTWGYGKSVTHSNHISNNYIHHCLQHVLNDGGGIYTLGKQPNTIIENNKIHDIYSRKTSGSASGCIYTDEGTGGILFRNNILFSSVMINFHHYGDGSLWYNNIMAYPTLRVFSSSNEVNMAQGVFNNIIASTCEIFDQDFFKYGRCATNNVIDSSSPKIPTGKNIYSNYYAVVPFADVANGNFKITRGFTIAEGFYVGASSGKGYMINTTFSDASYCGVYDGSLKSISEVTGSFSIDGQTVNFTNYYKRLAKKITGASNPYLDNN